MMMLFLMFGLCNSSVMFASDGGVKRDPHQGTLCWRLAKSGWCAPPVREQQLAGINIIPQLRFAHKSCAFDSKTHIRTHPRATTPVKLNLVRYNHFVMPFSRAKLVQAAKYTASACKKAKASVSGRFSCCFGTKPVGHDEGGTSEPPQELPAKPEPAVITMEANSHEEPLDSQVLVPATPPPPLPASEPPLPTPLLPLVAYEVMAESPPLGLTPGTTALVPYSITPVERDSMALAVAEEGGDAEDCALLPLQLSPALEAVLDYYLGEEGEEGTNEPINMLEWEEWRAWEEWCAVRELRG